MSALRVRNGRRWFVGGLAVVLVLLVGVVIVRSVFLRDQARPIPAEEALDVFHAQTTTTDLALETSVAATAAPTSIAAVVTTTTGVSPPALPEPGIYRYRTTGNESIDALGGTSHDYPAETTITVISSGCGVQLRWDALRERHDQWSLCATADGIALQPDGVQYHEFFSQPDDEALRCDRTVVLIPTATTADPVQQSCMLAEDPWLPRWEVLERSTRTIDGAQVDVRHVRMTIDDNDSYPEHTTVDWYLADTGLPVEVQTTKTSSSPSPVGAVGYAEQYHLELVTTTPLQ